MPPHVRPRAEETPPFPPAKPLFVPCGESACPRAGVSVQKANANISSIQSTVNAAIAAEAYPSPPSPPLSSTAVTPAPSPPAYGAAGYGNAGANFIPSVAANSLLNGKQLASGTTRTYYIACQEVLWNYTPSMTDIVSGGFVPDPYLPRGLSQKGWSKKRYVQYSDGTFTTTVPQPSWMGLMGPMMRLAVGDFLKVNFLNNCSIPTTMHAHGVRKGRSEGRPDGRLSSSSAPSFFAPSNSLTRPPSSPGHILFCCWTRSSTPTTARVRGAPSEGKGATSRWAAPTPIPGMRTRPRAP